MNLYSLILVFFLAIVVIALVVRRASRQRSEYERERLLTCHLAEAHPGLVVVSDAAGRFRAASKSFDRRFRCVQGEHGRPDTIQDILDKKSQYDYRNIVTYAFRTNEPVLDFKIRTVLEGHTQELLVTVIPVLASHGRRVGLINEFKSLNKPAVAGADFERLEKLTNVGQIAAGIAHELNTPLGAIILSADIIAESAHTTGLREQADKIKRQATHCSKVVKELLRYVKNDERIQERCGVGTIIARIRSLVEPELGARDITLDVHIETEDDTILCDENQVEQLFFNLFSNSFHAIGAGGRIWVRVNLDALLNQLVVTFEDNGSGIESQNMARIFDPFFTTKPGSEGTGLGLALCKRIMLDHGGKIEARSTRGQGAMFVLRFPAVS